MYTIYVDGTYFKFGCKMFTQIFVIHLVYYIRNKHYIISMILLLATF